MRICESANHDSDATLLRGDRSHSAYLRDTLIDVEYDEGGGDKTHGEDDADGVEQRDADLPDDLRVQLFLGVVHRVIRHGDPVPGGSFVFYISQALFLSTLIST